jgi:hypothetical protein
MNITESIAKEISFEVAEFLRKTPEIQVYANSNINQYQWRDSRFTETSDVWNNPSYDTRQEMRVALKTHLESKGDF